MGFKIFPFKKKYRKKTKHIKSVREHNKKVLEHHKHKAWRTYYKISDNVKKIRKS